MRTVVSHTTLLLATAVLVAWCEGPAWGQDLPDGHTSIFDQSGILWFTAQNANRVGWLDAVMPSPNACGSDLKALWLVPDFLLKEPPWRS